MSELFPLELFPGGGFDSSVITVIFVGLLVLWALTESFGFVFVGLVVPGYLTSVLVIAPASAGVVIVEALVTYALVRGISDWMGKAGAWSPFFGRDRFFAFVVLAVVVRLVGELWLWPEVWRWGASLLGTSIQPPGPLNSIGLVLVPLAANMFWKVGVRRGLTQLALPTALVWVLTTQVLLPLTNLRLAEFRLNYEDVAVDFLSSPRAYIILISAAVLSARFNLRFGWNFGGILVPALLAISWAEPTKALMTFGEVLILVAATTAVMKAPMVRNWNLEGPRKIVLVFGIGFLLKYVGSWVVLHVDPGLQLTDFFGFGYLLSSLLALKVIENGFSQTYLPTVAVSLAGFLVGAGVASGIRALDFGGVEPTRIESVREEPRQVDKASHALVRHAALLGAAPPEGAPISPGELDQLEALAARADQLLDGGELGLWRGIDAPADALGLDWQELRESDDNRVFLLAEPLGAYPDGARGWGAYLFRPGATGPVVQVPDVSARPERIVAALAVAQQIDARVLMLGATSKAGSGRTVEPLRTVLSPYHRVHLALRERQLLQLRTDRSAERARLYAGRRLDADLGVAELQETLGELQILWERPDDVDRQRDSTAGAFTTIVVGDDQLERAAGSLARQLPAGRPRSPLEPDSLVAHMHDWILGDEARIAHAYPELDVPPLPAEIELVDRAVITPIVRMARQPLPAWSTRRTVALARLVAGSVGLQLEKIRIADSEECYWALSEEPPRLRGFGFMLFACQARAPLVVQAPYPRKEYSTWRMGALLAQDLDARALLVGGPLRSASGALLGDALEQGTLLSASHRALQREYLEIGPPWALQIRGLAAERELDADLLVSLDRPVEVERAPAAIGALNDWFEERGLVVAFDDGQRAFAALRGLPDATQRYSREVADDHFARLWVDDAFRDTLTPSPSADRLAEVFASRGLAWEESPTLDALFEPARVDEPAAFTSRVDLDVTLAPARQKIDRFAATRNPVHLREGLAELEAAGLAPRLLLDRPRQLAWVVVEARVADAGAQRVALRMQGARFERSIAVDRAAPPGELALLLAGRLVAPLERPSETLAGGEATR